MGSFLSSGSSFFSGMTFVLLAMHCMYDARTRRYEVEALCDWRNVLTILVGAALWPFALLYLLWRLKISGEVER